MKPAHDSFLAEQDRVENRLLLPAGCNHPQMRQAILFADSSKTVLCAREQPPLSMESNPI